VLSSLDGALVLPLALGTLQPQNQLLGGLGLLSQDRLGLTSESLLLTIVPLVMENDKDLFDTMRS